MERERVNLSGNNSASSGAGTVGKENLPLFCEVNRHSFCQVILQDISDADGSSPNRLSQPLNTCSTELSRLATLCCLLNVRSGLAKKLVERKFCSLEVNPVVNYLSSLAYCASIFKRA